MRPVVLRVHHDRDPVVGDRDFHKLDAGGGTAFKLIAFDRARGPGDVEFATAELFKAAARTRDTDRDAHIILVFGLATHLYKLFGDRLVDWVHRARTINDDGQPVFAAAARESHQ